MNRPNGVRNALTTLLLGWTWAATLGGCAEDADAGDTTPDAVSPDSAMDAELDVPDADLDTGELDGAQPDADVTADTPPDVVEPPIDPQAAGPYDVGVSTGVWNDSSRDRALTVSVWYPAAPGAGPTASPGSYFAPEGSGQATWDAWIEAAPAGCPSTAMQARPNAQVAEVLADGPRWPVVVFSHCHSCTRFSTWTVAERLASWGFVVVAPDHAGNTLFETLEGIVAPLNGEFLAVRGADLAFVLEQTLQTIDRAPTSPMAPPDGWPGGLGEQADSGRVGVLGHSFGSVTAGLLTQTDPRVQAAAFLAAPVQNPLLPGVEASRIQVPSLFLLMQEDNSITTVGNTFLRQNVEAVGTPTWLVEFEDGGHWSVSDLCGLVEDFLPCCGEDTRMTNARETFVYRDPAAARALTASWVAAFFLAHLQDRQAAQPWLTDASWSPQTVLTTR